MKLTEARGWAITHWRKGLYIDTVRRTRVEAVAAFKEGYGLDDAEWASQRNSGVHRAVRVIVIPITPAGRPARANLKAILAQGGEDGYP